MKGHACGTPSLGRYACSRAEWSRIWPWSGHAHGMARKEQGLDHGVALQVEGHAGDQARVIALDHGDARIAAQAAQAVTGEGLPAASRL